MSSPAPAKSLRQNEDFEVELPGTVKQAATPPYTPRRYSPFHPTDDSTDAISPVVLDIERRLFTPERSSSRTLSYGSSEIIAEYACQNYSPRPDDFYFDDGLGGHVVKLELPESERGLLSAEGFLVDIRQIEEAIENVKTISITDPDPDDAHDLAKLDEREHLMMHYLELLENYEAFGYRVLREACMETVNSPRRRDKANVPADKVTLYALGVAGEMAVNTLREECYRRLDSIHALLHSRQALIDHGTVTGEANEAEAQSPADASAGFSQAVHATHSMIPILSRRRTLTDDTSVSAPTSTVSVPDKIRTRRQRMSETMSQSVAKTAAGVLADAPTQFTFRPDNHNQMKLWSDGISGMCTFTFQGKEASAYCRMWSKGSLLRVSVVVGGGFQSLDEYVNILPDVEPRLTKAHSIFRWLERTFKRHSATLKSNVETSSARMTRKPVHDTILGKHAPKTMPMSSSMPQLSISATHFNANSPSRSMNYGPRTPTTPGTGFDSTIRRSSMLRNVSASSTYQLGGDGPGSVGMPKSSTLAQENSDASSPLQSKRSRVGPTVLSNRSASSRESLANLTEVELAAEMKQIALTSSKTAVGR
ncbi:hypothetical protein QFC22_004152 [Naganishia vaughanmartiniae]|uniref:Uncharacterized protein n=1 Tax=Naganishia vaughanmartiniae TaxID=1424756 RepID=A0ACC2X3A0_9TREE|nr:hypothetical protein QFC22_004152 [Naganishia vaughanmartiniae]